MDRESRSFTIVGAGLGGALMAAYLGKAGYTVHLIEKRPDPRAGNVPAGRSINLALSTRGIHALEGVGVLDVVMSTAIAMPGRMMHSITGELTYQPYGTGPQHTIQSVSRGDLNIALLNAAERHPAVRVQFNTRCTGVDLDTATLELDQDGRTVRRPADIIIGSDGAFSTIRARMQHLDRFDYRQDYLTHGYKELTIPPADGGGFRLERNALHIWPRGGYMMIALPNHDGSFTCTLFWPFEGPVSFAAASDDHQVRRIFETQFPDALPLMPTLFDDFWANPTSSLVTVRCRPWFHGDSVVLLGDAAHAVVPFYGQGMNASFEDCTVLNECLAARAPDFGRAFAEYQRRRRVHTDTLADLAIGNFHEMRDHVASPWFLLKKKFERLLHRLFPRAFVPLYTLVTFTRMPYAAALGRSRRQNGIVAAVGLVALLTAITVLAILVP